MSLVRSRVSATTFFRSLAVLIWPFSMAFLDLTLKSSNSLCALSKLFMASKAEKLLSLSVVTLSQVLYDSEVLEAFEDRINTGKEPLSVAEELVEEVDRLISESTEADKLAISSDDDTFEHLITAVITHLETSPITRNVHNFKKLIL